MAKAPGRLGVVTKGVTPIAGITTMTISHGAEAIEVTDKDSNGFTEYLTAAATRQITLSVEGIYTQPILRDIAYDTAASQLLTDLTFKFSDAVAAKDILAGNFFMSKYEEGLPHDGATSFSCEFASSGLWTHS